jgi:hypothetical protein
MAQQQLFPASRELLPFLAKRVRGLLFRTPPRLNRQKSNWFLWQPQVERFLLRVNIDPRILQTEHAALFSDAQHATVVSIITEISPPRETEWFARLNFRLASLAWRELECAYAPRAELELQAKLEDLETASQAEGESIREWTLRLRRLALEIQAMNGQHVITDTAHKLKLLRIRPVPGAEEGYNAFLAGIRYSFHMKSVQQVEQELIAYEDGIQMQTRLLSHTQRSQVWHTRTGTAPPPPVGNFPTRATSSFPRCLGLASSVSMRTHQSSPSTTCAIAHRRAPLWAAGSMNLWMNSVSRKLQRAQSRRIHPPRHLGTLLQVLALD